MLGLDLIRGIWLALGLHHRLTRLRNQKHHQKDSYINGDPDVVPFMHLMGWPGLSGQRWKQMLNIIDNSFMNASTITNARCFPFQNLKGFHLADRPLY